MKRSVSDPKRLSKLLSLILRHRPDEFGLNMDAYGYVPLADLLEAVQERYKDVSEEDIRSLVEEANQSRFEIGDGGVRALYGHSFFVEMDGEPMEPPEKLYMGSTASIARKMKAEGARPVDRFYLHLSQTREVAESRSRQLDVPCVVEILAQKAQEEEEVQFYVRGEVVLSQEISADCIGEISGLEGGREPEQESRSRGRGGRSRSASQGGYRSSSSPPSGNQHTPPAKEEQPKTFGRRPRRQTGYGRR